MGIKNPKAYIVTLERQVKQLESKLERVEKHYPTVKDKDIVEEMDAILLRDKEKLRNLNRRICEVQDYYAN